MMTWFRFYSEAVKDTKVRRIARKVKTSPAEVVGVWCIVLSLASESPTRGVLLLSDGIPVTEDDIADIAGCDVAETLRELACNGMITVTGDLISVTAWDKRQFASDISTPRVQEYRSRQRKQSETFLKRSVNVAETPSDHRSQITDTETDQPPPPPSVKAAKPNGSRVIDDDDFSQVEKAHGLYVGARISKDQAFAYEKWLRVTTPAAIISALEAAQTNSAKAPHAYAMRILQNKHEAGELPRNGPTVADFDAPLDVTASWM